MDDERERDRMARMLDVAIALASFPMHDCDEHASPPPTQVEIRRVIRRCDALDKAHQAAGHQRAA